MTAAWDEAAKEFERCARDPPKSGIKFYKAVLVNGEAPEHPNFRYDLPKEGKPGDWTPMVEQIEFCRLGYHFTVLHCLRHFSRRGYRYFEVEYQGRVLGMPDDIRALLRLADVKLCASSIRLVREVNYDALSKGLDWSCGTLETHAKALMLNVFKTTPEIVGIDTELAELAQKARDLTGRRKELALAHDVKYEGEYLVALKQAYDNLAAKLATLPVREFPVVSLESFADNNKLKLMIRQVASGYGDHDIPGTRAGAFVVSLAATLRREGRDGARMAARGMSVSDALIQFCRAYSGCTISPKGVVLPDGSPYQIDVPVLIPKEQLGDEAIEKEIVAASKDAKATKNPKPPAKKPAKTSGKKRR